MAPTEDDLRAAFQLAAQDAPSTDDVLARLRAAEAPNAFAAPGARASRVRQWLPVAAVAAVVIAIAVPVGFAISSGGSGSKASSGSASFGDRLAAPEAGASSAASAAAGAESGPGSVVGGPVAGGSDPSPLLPGGSGTAGPSGPVCTPADVDLALTWSEDNGRLTGVLTATNHSSAACDLAVKPAIYPLGTAGTRLPVQNVASAEGYAGPSGLAPGASATSTVTWMSWCGAKATEPGARSIGAPAPRPSS